MCRLVWSVMPFDCQASSEVLGIWHFNMSAKMQLNTSVLQRYAVLCILVCLSFEKARSQGLKFLLCLVPVILFVFVPLHEMRILHLHTTWRIQGDGQQDPSQCKDTGLDRTYVGDCCGLGDIKSCRDGYVATSVPFEVCQGSKVACAAGFNGCFGCSLSPPGEDPSLSFFLLRSLHLYANIHSNDVTFFIPLLKMGTFAQVMENQLLVTPPSHLRCIGMECTNLFASLVIIWRVCRALQMPSVLLRGTTGGREFSNVRERPTPQMPFRSASASHLLHFLHRCCDMVRIAPCLPFLLGIFVLEVS